MVFLSYSREDRPVAMKLERELFYEGIKCALDPELVEGDAFWRETVARNVADCDLMVGLVSNHSLASPWVEQEQRAFSGRKLWLALDIRTRAAAALTMGADKLVPIDAAVSTIRAALPRRSCHPKSMSGMIAADRTEARLTRIRKAEEELAAFRASSLRIPRPKLESVGDTAFIGDGFLTLRRIVARAADEAFLADTDYPSPPTWERTDFRSDAAPVTGVNWFEASAFAFWVNGSLPTEADWADAAGGADSARAYATATGALDDHLACFGRPFGATAPEVAMARPPNAEGYYGMCGNTWDWCATQRGAHRAIRGGGYMDAPRFCTVQASYRNSPIDRDCCVGFRIKVAAPRPSPSRRPL